MTTQNLIDRALSGRTGTGSFVGATSPTLVTPILGAASATSLIFSSTSGIIGTTTNNSAATGSVGEYVSSTILVTSAVPITSGTVTDVTSISLTAGDWDVWATLCIHPAATTSTTSLAMWTSTSSATIPTAPNNGSWTVLSIGFTANTDQSVPIGRQRISLSGTTSVFMTCFLTFITSTMGAYGFIGARRVR